VTHINHTQDNRKGDMAEFYAVTWLWDNGYEVFKNCGCTGPVDLIATKDGKTTLIDVKTKSGRSGRTRSIEQLQLDVKILNYNPETRKLNFVKHQK
tara:strand:- start:6 stop:293 length:288 start_codon:yes stop_codon:yes gene_type:complete